MTAQRLYHRIALRPYHRLLAHISATGKNPRGYRKAGR